MTMKNILFLSICILIGGVSLILMHIFPICNYPDKMLYTTQFPGKEYCKQIVIIEINDETIRRFGDLPWDRNVYAKLVKILNNYNPKVIAFDLLFDSEMESIGDLAFAQAVHEAKNVIVTSFIKANLLILKPYKLLSDNVAGIGYANILIDNCIGAMTVNTNAINSVDSKPIYHFVFEIVKNFFGEQIQSDNYGLTFFIGEEMIPHINPITLDSYEFPIYYIGDKSKFKTYPLHDIIDNKTDLSKIKDKIVLIGCTYNRSKDRFNTPISFGKKQMPGVVIWANAIATVLKKKFIYGYSREMFYLIIVLLVSLLFGYICLKIKPKKSITLIFIILICYSMISYVVFKTYLVFINVSPVLISAILIVLLSICCRGKLGRS